MALQGRSERMHDGFVVGVVAVEMDPWTHRVRVMEEERLGSYMMCSTMSMEKVPCLPSMFLWRHLAPPPWRKEVMRPDKLLLVVLEEL
jgi:hypothetical protein